MRGAMQTVALLVAVSLRPVAADPPPHAEWEMTFQDEFDGDSVDWEVWESQSGPRGRDRLEGRWPENNIVKDGILYQVTRKEDPPRGGKDWSTAHLWTRDFTQQYGYFECRMRYGRCLNNAFWLYRPRGRFLERPHFEIDINEGHTPREVAMCFHWYAYYDGDETGELCSTGKRWEAPMDLAEDFHVYGVEWDEKLIIWYFDGEPIRVLENPGAHAPADIRLSTVIHLRTLEREGADLSTMNGVSMAVDWVRVHRKTKDLYEPELPEAEKLKIPRLVKLDPQVIPAGERTVLLEEDFEAAPEGGLPAGWEVGEGEPTVVADTAEDGKEPLAPDNRLLKLAANEYAFRMFDTPVSGRLEVQFDCFIPGKEPSLLLVTLGEFDTSDPEGRKTSYYTGDIGPYIHWEKGYLRYYTETEKWVRFARWPLGRWQQVRFLLDVSRGVFDCYGGEGAAEFLSGGPFRHDQRAAKGIGLRNRGDGEPVYVDNVVVRRLGE